MTAGDGARQRRERLQFLLRQRAAEPVRQRWSEFLDTNCPGNWELIAPPESEPLYAAALTPLRTARRLDQLETSGETTADTFRIAFDQWLAGLPDRALLVFLTNAKYIGVVRIPAPALRAIAADLLESDRDSLIVAEPSSGVGAVAQRFERHADTVTYLLDTWYPVD